MARSSHISLVPGVVVFLLALAACGAGPERAVSGGAAAADGARALTVSAKAAGSWAPVGKANITPGVQTYTDGAGQCTANFVFTDRRGRVYVGQAAHCATQGESSDTNGCKVKSLPTGTPVTFRSGGSAVSDGETVGSGTLAYSSWITMRKAGETDEATCAYNDFALVRVDRGSVDAVNPSLPFWGGPVGLASQGVEDGETVHSYGNSSLRAGISELSPQTGRATGDDPSRDGWAHDLHAKRPGIPGDSGSAFLDGKGDALGTLSTLGLSIPITNTIGDLYQELSYARKHSGIKGLRLVLGTRKFRAEGWEAAAGDGNDQSSDRSGGGSSEGDSSGDAGGQGCQEALADVPGLAASDIERACAELQSAGADADRAAVDAACDYAVSSVPEPAREAAHDACVVAVNG